MPKASIGDKFFENVSLLNLILDLSETSIVKEHLLA